jgi:hypothetical protein
MGEFSIPSFLPDRSWKYFTIYMKSRECFLLSHQILEELSEQEEQAKKGSKPKGFAQKKQETEDEDEGSTDGLIEDCVYDLETAIKEMLESLEKIKQSSK